MAAGLVYGVLLDYCGDKNYCWPSQARIAQDVGLSVRTVQNLLSELIEKGFISCQRRAGTNVYTVLPHPSVLPFMESDPSKCGTTDKGRAYARDNASLSYRKKEEKIHTPPPPKVSCTICAMPVADGASTVAKSVMVKPVAEPDFERVWQAWPVREARKSALRLWQRLKRLGQLPSISKLLELVRAHIERNPRWKRGYVPYLVTWLKGRRWEDELPAKSVQATQAEEQKASGPVSKAQATESEKATQASTSRVLLQRENTQTPPPAPLDELSPEGSQRLEQVLALWPVKPATPCQQSWARGLWRYLTRNHRLPDIGIIQEASVSADVTFGQWLHDFCQQDTRRCLESFAT